MRSLRSSLQLQLYRIITDILLDIVEKENILMTLHVFPSSDGEMAGLVLRKPEGLRDWYNLVQKQVSVTQVWHKCDTSVTSYYVDV